MRNLLRFILWDSWDEIFGKDDTKREDGVILSTEDYVIALEIIAEAPNISHGFSSFLSHIINDYDKVGYRKMWQKEFAQRTAIAIKTMSLNALRNSYIVNSEPFIVLEKQLELLRRRAQVLDFANFVKVQRFHKRLQLIEKNKRQAAEKRFAAEN